MPPPAAAEPPLPTRPVLLGVCAHLAGRLRVPPVWLRAAVVLLTLATPWTALAYALARLLIWDPTTAGLGLADRVREEFRQTGERLDLLRLELAQSLEDWSERRSSPDPLSRWRAILGALLLGGGALLLMNSFGLLDWLTVGRGLALALALLGVALLRSSS